MRRPFSVLVGAVVFATALLIGSMPAMTWFQQHKQLAQADSQLVALNQKNALLAKDAAQLRNLQYVGTLARSQYGLVPKGSRAYVILPPPKGSTRP